MESPTKRIHRQENCLNCSQPYSTSRWKVDYIMFIDTESYAETETTAKIIDVGAALSTIFKLGYLPEFNSTSFDTAAVDDASDDQEATDKTPSPAVCSVCAQVLTNLKKYFDEFNALRQFDSYLSMKTREVDEIITKYQSSSQQQPQQQCELSDDDRQDRIHEDTSTNLSQNDVKLTTLPSVKLKRLTSEELAAAAAGSTTIPDNSINQLSAVPIISVQLNELNLTDATDSNEHKIDNSASEENDDDDVDDDPNFSDVEVVDLIDDDSTDEDISSDVEDEPSIKPAGVVNVVVNPLVTTTTTSGSENTSDSHSQTHPTTNGNNPRTLETLNSFICSKCDKSFKAKFCLQVCSIRNGRTMSCPICDACFTSFSSSNPHHQISPLQAFCCTLCRLTFADCGALVEHSRTHLTSSSSAKPTPSDNALPPTSNIFYERTRSQECPHCHRKLATVDELEVHFGNCKVLTKPFVCAECGLKFSHKHLLNKHAVVHLKELPYACENCDQRFLRKGNLVAHQQRRHSTNTFQCPQCPKVFRQEQSLKNHLSVHSGIRPHLCASCGKAFRTKHGIMIHRRTHTGERPSVCKFCSASFSTSSSRKNHENIHLETRPFICDACGKGFCQKQNLKRHRRVHAGEKQHKCQVCDLRFVDKRGLTKHMLNHNDESNKSLKKKSSQRRRKKGT